jgi:hypothetical protein
VDLTNPKEMMPELLERMLRLRISFEPASLQGAMVGALSARAVCE